MVKKRQHCERVGCSRFRYDLVPTSINGRTVKLCNHCAAIILDMANRRIAQNGSVLSKLMSFATDSYDRAVNGIRGISFDKVHGVYLWRPWKEDSIIDDIVTKSSKFDPDTVLRDLKEL